MSIIVHSPYSGRPVKVRDEDLGRAIRDEAGKVFYVVQRASGKGYYGSATRHGSARDEAKYDELLAGATAESASVVMADQVDENTAKPKASAASQPVHDATGRGSTGSPSKRIILILAIFVALLVIYLWYVQPALAQPQGVQPLPANPAVMQQPAADEDPATAQARTWYSIRVYGVGMAAGIVFLYFLARWANRKRAERLERMEQQSTSNHSPPVRGM